MKIVAELHSHTNVSGHAFNTLTEMITRAKELGLQALAVTNHTPGVIDSPTFVHFNCFKYLPRCIDGVYLFSGCETNIMDFDGNVDWPDEKLDKLDYRIASKHEPLDMTFPSRWGSCEENTQMYLNVLNNPHIDSIGHPCNTVVPFDYEPVVKKAAECGKVLELNVSYPKRSKENRQAAYDIMKLCKQYNVLTAVTTDAHSIYVMGDIQIGTEILEELKYPEELVINSSMGRLREYFIERRGRDFLQDSMCI